MVHLCVLCVCVCVCVCVCLTRVFNLYVTSTVLSTSFRKSFFAWRFTQKK